MDDNPQTKALRQQLVTHLHGQGLLSNPGVESAFAEIPRHLFLPHISPEEAYSDEAVGLKYDSGGLMVSSASQPSMIASMLDQAQIQAGDNVLEIGIGSGYTAALLRHIVGANGHVTSVEIDTDLAQQASENLANARISGVRIVNEDAMRGYSPRASYDCIFSPVGVWDVSPDWVQQLKPGGVLVVALFLDGMQTSAKFEMQPDGTLLSVDNRPCAFVYLRGEYAGPSIRKHVGSSSLYIIADQVDEIDTVSLHLLISHDHELCYLESPLRNKEFWYGFQPYLMINEPKGYIFLLYAVIEGRSAYGLERRGMALVSHSSASFVPYHALGEVHCYAGADSFLAIQTALDEWNALNRPTMERLHLRLIPRTKPKPEISTGKLYERRDHYLHAWLAL